MIPSFVQSRFDRIRTEDGIAVLLVTDKTTQQPRYLIVSVLHVGDDYVVAPLGEIFDAERSVSIMDEVLEP